MDISKALYPFEHHYLDVGGHKYHYLDEGQGKPVLMVHGNPTWSFYYRDLIRALCPDHRCIVPDHIGCGFSDKPDDAAYPYTLEQRVSDLTALVDHLALKEPLTLVVHDWGGMIGLAWAVEHPEQVSRLVLLNTAGFPKPESKRLPWLLKLARDTALGAFLVQGFNAFSVGATRLAVKKHLPAEVRRAYRAPYDSWKNRIATLRFVQDIPLEPGDPAWDSVTRTAKRLSCLADLPALICWGERDFVFDHHFLERWKQILPNARLRTFPEAGHYVLEDESEAICKEVRGFLGEKSG